MIKIIEVGADELLAVRCGTCGAAWGFRDGTCHVTSTNGPAAEAPNACPHIRLLPKAAGQPHDRLEAVGDAFPHDSKQVSARPIKTGGMTLRVWLKVPHEPLPDWIPWGEFRVPDRLCVVSNLVNFLAWDAWWADGTAAALSRMQYVHALECLLGRLMTDAERDAAIIMLPVDAAARARWKVSG